MPLVPDSAGRSKRWQSHFTPLTIGDSKSRISDQDASPVSECSPLATVTNANPGRVYTRVKL
jgi:hypothetical protein